MSCIHICCNLVQSSADWLRRFDGLGSHVGQDSPARRAQLQGPAHSRTAPAQDSSLQAAHEEEESRPRGSWIAAIAKRQSRRSKTPPRHRTNARVDSGFWYGMQDCWYVHLVLLIVCFSLVLLLVYLFSDNRLISE